MAVSGERRREQTAQGVSCSPSKISIPANILRQVSGAIKVTEPGDPSLQIMLHEKGRFSDWIIKLQHL